MAMGKSMAIVGLVFTLAAAPAHAAPLDDNAWKELRVRLAAWATGGRGGRRGGRAASSGPAGRQRLEGAQSPLGRVGDGCPGRQARGCPEKMQRGAVLRRA